MKILSMEGNWLSTLALSLIHHSVMQNKMMKVGYVWFLMLIYICSVHYLEAKQIESKKTIYLFPGQGSDSAMFTNFNPGNDYIVKHITYPVPHKKCTLPQYACIISEQVDTSGNFILLGVSLGGMICVELTGIMNPRDVIIVSSAKNRMELPFRYRFQKYLPLYKLIPKKLIKAGALFLQPFVEPDVKNERQVFRNMLGSKDPAYLKRTIDMIVRWDRKKSPPGIIHIHGDNDHTIPIRNVEYTHPLLDGSHMMIYTKGGEISGLVKRILQKQDS